MVSSVKPRNRGQFCNSPGTRSQRACIAPDPTAAAVLAGAPGEFDSPQPDTRSEGEFLVDQPCYIRQQTSPMIAVFHVKFHHRSFLVRHPPRSGWLDELGRLKDGRSMGLGVARCAPYWWFRIVRLLHPPLPARGCMFGPVPVRTRRSILRNREPRNARP